MKRKNRAAFANGHNTPRPTRIRQNRGFSLIEVLISLFIFAMMGLMFAAVVPTALRSAKTTNTTSQAMTICNRKMDQLIEAGFNRLDSADLLTLGIIDNNAGTITAGANGSVYTYSFIANNTATNTKNPDNLGTFFPAGTTGKIRIEPWGPSMWLLNGTMQPMMMQVTVTVTWRNGSAPQQSVSLSSLITRMAIT